MSNSSFLGDDFVLGDSCIRIFFEAVFRDGISKWYFERQNMRSRTPLVAAQIVADAIAHPPA
jgi:hypothetical protein